MLKQGGLDSTGRREVEDRGSQSQRCGGVTEEEVRKSFVIPPEIVGIMETGIFLVLVSGRRHK